jgi:hypothetical protein
LRWKHIRAVGKQTKEPVPLEVKAKRLKSLDEFEPPYWLGLFQPGQVHWRFPAGATIIGLLIGLSLGWFLFVRS